MMKETRCCQLPTLTGTPLLCCCCFLFPSCKSLVRAISLFNQMNLSVSSVVQLGEKICHQIVFHIHLHFHVSPLKHHTPFSQREDGTEVDTAEWMLQWSLNNSRIQLNTHLFFFCGFVLFFKMHLTYLNQIYPDDFFSIMKPKWIAAGTRSRTGPGLSSARAAKYISIDIWWWWNVHWEFFSGITNSPTAP